MAGNRHSQYRLKSSFNRENGFFQFTATPKRPYNRLRNFYGEAMERLGNESYEASERLELIPEKSTLTDQKDLAVFIKNNNDRRISVFSLLLTIILTSALLFLLT